MKTTRKTTILLAFALFASVSFAQVGIGTSSPNANAALDVEATDKGVMVPRLTNAEASTLALGLAAADDGLVIYNTDEKCIQFWDGALLDFICAARVTGGFSGNAGQVKVNVDGAQAAAEAGDTTHPSALVYTTQNDKEFYPFGSTALAGNGGPSPGVNVTAADLSLSGSPTTSWPANETNQTLAGGIYTDENVFESTPALTADAWRENDISGQVHIWRVQVIGNPNNSSGGEFEARLRNPESGFVTGYAQVVPAASGIYFQTFTFTTIADDGSLPSGGGDGYVLEFRSNAGALEVWVESITRVSLYAE